MAVKNLSLVKNLKRGFALEKDLNILQRELKAYFLFRAGQIIKVILQQNRKILSARRTKKN